MLVEVDTQYNRYRIEDLYYNGRPARVLFSGQHQAAQSGMPHDDNTELLFDYNERFMELVRGLLPRSILILGGGAFTLPVAIMRELPESAIDIVELDGDLVDIAVQFFDFHPTKHARVHIGDARTFLDTATKKYDLVIVDVYDHAEIPRSFRDPAAARALRNRLTKHGMVAINVIAAAEGQKAAVLRQMRAAMQTAFPTIAVFPARQGLSPWISQNYILVAQPVAQDVAPFFRYPAVEV